MRAARRCSAAIALGCWILGAACGDGVWADETEIFVSSAMVKPNVLLILDNSNSMDQDFLGNSVTSWATGSRSVEGRKALIDIVHTYANTMRIGLMTYRLPSADKRHLHNAEYFVSYQEKSYCPNPPPECADYCRTGSAASQAACQAACAGQNTLFDAAYLDEIIPHYAVGTEQRNRYCSLVYPKARRVPNPTSTAHYLYYKIPGTFYSGTNQGADFCYSSAYNPSETGGDSYACYNNKTDASDGYSGYSSGSMSGSFSPTDEDIALGFRDFGRRMAWTYAGQTWFANSSPGGGYLHVAINENDPSNDNQKNALLAKLATKENDESGYMACTSTSNPNACAYVVNAGLTPTAGTLRSALNYFKGEKDYQSNVNYTSPIQDWCQKHFVIYVTDGLPSVDQNGNTGTAANLMPEVLSKIDALRATTKKIGGATYTFDINIFVLGMGLTDEAKAQLDAMAVRGGTDVDGHAYYADNPSQLATALAQVFATVIERGYSFSTASVSSARLSDENFLYEASFEPVSGDPFWKGYLKKYSINEDGTLGNVLWDAGNVLKNTAAANRNLHSFKDGSLTPFTTTNMTPADLGVADQATADGIVHYIRGVAGSNPDNWKLGDIFHSHPITIGTPSYYYRDILDANSAFAAFRTSHERTSASGKRVIVVGANDGQLHAFKTADGAEFWSFLPPNLLPKLQYLAHQSHPTTQTHQYFVDGPVTVADVWLGTGSGAAKSASDWKTVGIFSVGRNDGDYTVAAPGVAATKYWSSSASCDAGLSHTYSATTNNYCGYYAFDFTGVTASNPGVIPGWTTPLIKPREADAPYLGEPWSRVAIGRVRDGGNERWIGFFGGGFHATECPDTGTCDGRGKGFFVVDLKTGEILWSYTRANNADMQYGIPASPALADTDNDGFIDSAYVGDMGGNMWRFNFCRKAMGTGTEVPDLNQDACSTGNWSGGLLITKIPATDKQPIYTQATLAKDANGDLWVYWGTGNKINPTGTEPSGYIYGVKPLACKDAGGNPSPCVRSDLGNLTSVNSTFCSTSDLKGWYINLPGAAEKVLAEPVAYGNVLYVTTYTPSQGGSGCSQAGTARLYALNIAASCIGGPGGVGSGALDASGTRSVVIGVGIPSAPIISLRPGSSSTPDIYVTTSGGGGQSANTARIDFNPPSLGSRTNMLYWRDRRIQ